MKRLIFAALNIFFYGSALSGGQSGGGGLNQQNSTLNLMLASDNFEYLAIASTEKTVVVNNEVFQPQSLQLSLENGQRTFVLVNGSSELAVNEGQEETLGVITETQDEVVVETNSEF